MSPAGKWGTASVPALRARRLAAGFLVLHLTWEIAQLPLYAVARGDAGVHRVGGDPLHRGRRPDRAGHLCGGERRGAFRRLAQGIAGQWPGRSVGERTRLDRFQWWRHVQNLGSWAYAESMPTLAGIGLAPLAQWVIVPGLALWCLREWHPVRAPADSMPPTGDEDRAR